MARPQKQTVDYFPHYVTDGKTLLILQNEFGNDGYAFWFKMLSLLCISDGQSFDYSNPASWRLLLAKTHVKEDIAVRILDILSEVQAIDKELYEHHIIWVQNLVDNLDLVYNRRATGKPKKPVITNNNISTGGVSANNNQVNANIKPHTKQYNTKQYNNSLSEISKSLTGLLKNLILENNPIAKVPDDTTKWAKEIDLMIRQDKRMPELIEQVIRWSQADSFWKTNIRSADSLRKQFDQLYMKMKPTGGTYHGTNAAYKSQPTGTSTPPHAIDGDAEAPPEKN